MSRFTTIVFITPGAWLRLFLDESCHNKVGFTSKKTPPHLFSAAISLSSHSTLQMCLKTNLHLECLILFKYIYFCLHLFRKTRKGKATLCVPPSIICRKLWMFTRTEDTRKGGFGEFSTPLEASSSIWCRHSNSSVLSLLIQQKMVFPCLAGVSQSLIHQWSVRDHCEGVFAGISTSEWPK